MFTKGTLLLSKIEASLLNNQRNTINRFAAWGTRLYSTTSIWEHFFATAVLIFLVYYALRILIYAPYLGFTIGAYNDVTTIFVPQQSYPKLETGDQISQINQHEGVEFYSYFTNQNYNNVRVGDAIRLEVFREGTPLNISWIISGFSTNEFLERLIYLIIPFTFWFFGVITALVIRPKNSRLRYLVAFYYITAIWLMGGTASSYLFPHTNKIFNTALWLSIPIYFILHWDLTRSADTLNKKFVYGLYLFVLILSILNLVDLLPQNTSIAGLMISVFACIYLLITHLIFHKGNQDVLIKLLTIMVIIFILPTIITGFLYITNRAPGNGGIAIFTLIFIPMTYFLITSHNKLYILQIRSNRTITLLLYGLMIFSICTSIALFTQAFFQYTNISLVVMIILLVVISSISIITFPWFQRLIDQRFFGVKYPPETMIEHFTTRITTSLDADRLVRVLINSVFPSLLIREAAIFMTPGRKLNGNPPDIKPILFYGLPASQIPSREELISISESVSSGVSKSANPSKNMTTTWVKLVLPLRVDNQFIGISLFGRRDPDDYYSDLEIKTLKTIMNHTALALVNIDQAQQLHALYQNDIERQEEERSRLARELHDNVLGKIALFAHTSRQKENEIIFTKVIESSVHEIRDIIHNLRPSMLNFGLVPAINELVDELSTAKSVYTQGVSINLDINSDQYRFPPDVELHVYRIVQEASHNALTHASCESLWIKGEIKENLVDLTIADNGTGFETREQIDLTTLLSKKQYGLAGMYERSHLINAEISILSSPGTGTEIRVLWKADRTSYNLNNEKITIE